jgi:hypothetical protein
VALFDFDPSDPILKIPVVWFEILGTKSTITTLGHLSKDTTQVGANIASIEIPRIRGKLFQDRRTGKSEVWYVASTVRGKKSL